MVAAQSCLMEGLFLLIKRRGEAVPTRTQSGLRQQQPAEHNQQQKQMFNSLIQSYLHHLF